MNNKKPFANKILQFISAFEPRSEFGGGVVTTRFIKILSIYDEISWFRKNNESRILRYLRILLIWLKTPYIYPIFCGYPLKLITRDRENIILNFSQCFSLLERYKFSNSTLIVHDVYIQKRLPIIAWLAFSEKRLLKKADKIITLSEKDKKIITRFYKIDKKKVENYLPKIFPELHFFQKKIVNIKKFRVVFLGSLLRIENKRGFDWFYEHVFPSCSDKIDVTCIGMLSEQDMSTYPNINFCGFVEDLSLKLKDFDLSIAPLIDGAGIKIKVVDMLGAEIPVLGTSKAFEGLGRPCHPFCSNDAKQWIEVLNTKKLFFEYQPPN